MSLDPSKKLKVVPIHTHTHTHTHSQCTSGTLFCI